MLGDNSDGLLREMGAEYKHKHCIVRQINARKAGKTRESRAHDIAQGIEPRSLKGHTWDWLVLLLQCQSVPLPAEVGYKSSWLCATT